MIFEIIFVTLTVLFAATTGFFFVVSRRAFERVRKLEYLFIDTLDDMQHSAEIFHQLVNRRALLSDDPDVQRIRRVFGVTLDILGEYIAYGKQLTAETQKEKIEEEQTE